MIIMYQKKKWGIFKAILRFYGQQGVNPVGVLLSSCTKCFSEFLSKAQEWGLLSPTRKVLHEVLTSDSSRNSKLPYCWVVHTGLPCSSGRKDLWQTGRGSVETGGCHVTHELIWLTQQWMEWKALGERWEGEGVMCYRYQMQPYWRLYNGFFHDCPQ